MKGKTIARQRRLERVQKSRSKLRAEWDRGAFRRHRARADFADALQAATLDTPFHAVLIVDGDRRVLAASPAAEDLFGRSSADLSALMLDDLLRNVTEDAAAGVADLPAHGRRLMALGADGTRHPIDVATRTFSGDERDFIAYHIRPAASEPLSGSVLEQQRHHLHQVEKWSAMSALLAGVAHELNNPLAILVAQSTLLREKAPTADIQRRAERIYAAAQRAGRIVKGFLAMAREKPPVREPVNLNEVLGQALELVGYSLRSAGIEPVRQFDAELPSVQADPDLMGQVFAHLIINAQESLLGRPADRRLVLRSYTDAGAVVVDVEDNGRGVPDDLKARIFEPYFTTKSAGAGTGIGLSLCRSVLDAHAGSVQSCEVDAGALFRVSVPLASRREPDVTPAQASAADTLSILVVDDEIDVARSLGELLELFGHRVRVETCPDDVPTLVGSERFDIVFSDFRMPTLDGLELRRRIAAVDPTLAGRTVIMTGDTLSRLDDDDALGSPLNVLEKPFTASSVKGVLAQVMGR